MMKTLSRLLLNSAAALCLFLQTATAQNIPDPNFADAIRDVCPTCIDINNNLTPAAQDLDSLKVWYKNISNLAGIEGFINLTYLKCDYNNLNSLPTLPSSLKYLGCSQNHLNLLPELPASLTTLECNHNQLDSLPALPTNLAFLGCAFNQLDFLPNLPPNLKELGCLWNQLDSLPILPAKLTLLDCGYNQLHSLPVLPANLKTLFCSSNSLASLPELPASLTILYCDDNPSLFCLPLLPNGLKHLFTPGTQITCIPNQPADIITMNPPLPLCSEPCDSSVSTSNVYAAKPFSVLPNPVSEVLQVRFSADYEGNADFRLLDSKGRVVRALSGKGDVEIPVGDLPQGIYWLEVRGARWIFGEKILKK